MRLRETREAAADAYVTGPDGLEDATDREEMELLGASGVTIIMISAALGGPTAMKGMEPKHPPDTEKVEAVRARIRRRRRLGLRHRDCLRRDCVCGALTDTLDELDESATKDEILRAARGLHKSRNPRFAPSPIPRVQAKSHAPPKRPTTPAAPIPAVVVNETSAKPFRVVRRRPKWWDGPRGSGGIMEKVF
jgi:hypothetical protein